MSSETLILIIVSLSWSCNYSDLLNFLEFEQRLPHDLSTQKKIKIFVCILLVSLGVISKLSFVIIYTFHIIPKHKYCSKQKCSNHAPLFWTSIWEVIHFVLLWHLHNIILVFDDKMPLYSYRRPKEHKKLVLAHRYCLSVNKLVNIVRLKNNCINVGKFNFLVIFPFSRTNNFTLLECLHRNWRIETHLWMSITGIIRWNINNFTSSFPLDQTEWFVGILTSNNKNVVYIPFFYWNEHFFLCIM